MQQSRKIGGAKSFARDHGRCGDCSGFDHTCVKDNKLCSNVGILPTSKTCESFKPHVKQFATGKNVNDLELLGKLIHKFSPRDRSILANILVREHITRKYGYSFGQKVYLQITGTSNALYMSNFASAIVLDCDKTNIRLMSETGAILSILRDGAKIYTASQFKPLRIEMHSRKRFVDPASNKKGDVGSIPTLDSVINDGSLESSKRMKKQGAKLTAKRTDDLTTFANRLSRGHVVKHDSRGKHVEVMFGG